VLIALRDCLKTLLIQPSCPICTAPLQTDQDHEMPCQDCCSRLGLSTTALTGSAPIPWIAAGLYEGSLRRLLLQLRKSRDLSKLRAISTTLRDQLPQQVVLVPIPSWKHQTRANPLPELLSQALDRPCRDLLRRARAVIGQHHLKADQRQTNQLLAFSVIETAISEPLRQGAETWIVDDILTSGATARSAMGALQNAGWPVAGLVCLGGPPLYERGIVGGAVCKSKGRD